MKLQPFELLRHRGSRAGQEAGAHPVGDGTEAQVETGGLDLVGVGGSRCDDTFALEQRANGLRRKNAVFGCGHRAPLDSRFPP